LRGIDVSQRAHEPFDALIARSKRELVDKILIDSLGVSLQTNLFFDPFPVRLAQRAGKIEAMRFGRRGLKSRWSREWRSLI
jgi:hypothetical protein